MQTAFPFAEIPEEHRTYRAGLSGTRALIEGMDAKSLTVTLTAATGAPWGA